MYNFYIAHFHNCSMRFTQLLPRRQDRDTHVHSEYTRNQSINLSKPTKTFTTTETHMYIQRIQGICLLGDYLSKLTEPISQVPIYTAGLRGGTR